MEFLLILLLLAVFVLPSFFMMRTQRKRQAEVQQLQNSLSFGDEVVTASGLHGTVTAIRETEVQLALAPGVEVTMEKMAVIRHAHDQNQQRPGDAGEYPGQHPAQGTEDPRGFRAEGDAGGRNESEDGDRRDGDHPENLR